MNFYNVVNLFTTFMVSSKGLGALDELFISSYIQQHQLIKGHKILQNLIFLYIIKAICSTKKNKTNLLNKNNNNLK